MLLVANAGWDIFLELGNFVSNHVVCVELGIYCV